MFRFLFLAGAIFVSTSLTRVLPAQPLLCDAVLVSDVSLLPQGQTQLRVHWGRVIATGDLRVLDLDFSDWENTLTLYANNKALGAGIDYNIAPFLGKDYWLRWQCSGQLLQEDSGSPPVFPATGLSGVPVTDFFNQLMNGSFSGYSSSTLELAGKYQPLTMEQGLNILYDAPVAGVHPTGRGALVQNNAAIATEVNDLITSELSYSRWKALAIASKRYLRPTTTNTASLSFINHDGDPLYASFHPAGERLLTTSSVNAQPLTNLAQLSMHNLLNASEVGPGNSSPLPDRFLFVDTLEGTFNGTRVELKFNSTFFWKGMLYLNADLDALSGNFPDLLVKDPDQYAADPTGNTTGIVMPRCIQDGILFVRGTVRRAGNGTVYGSLINSGGTDSGGLPRVCYHSRLRSQGIPLPYGGDFISVQSGNWLDPMTWGGIGVPDAGSSVTVCAGHSVSISGLVNGLRSLTNAGTIECSGELAFDHGTMSNTGVIVTYSCLLNFKGGGNLDNSGTFTGPSPRFIFGDIHGSSTSTLTGNISGGIELIRCQLDASAASVEATTFTLRGNEARLSDGDVVYPYGGVLKYEGYLSTSTSYEPADFTCGNEWPVDTMYYLGGPTNVFVGPLTTAALGNSGGQDYWCERLTLGIGDDGVGPADFFSPVAGTFYTAEISGGTYHHRGETEAALHNYNAVITTRTLTSLGIMSFGPCEAELTCTELDAPTTVSVMRSRFAHEAAPPPIAASGQHYEIHVTGGDITANLKLPHQGLTDPFICRYTGNETSWTPGRSRFDETTVELDGITEFSTWAVGDAAIGPLPVTVSTWVVE